MIKEPVVDLRSDTVTKPCSAMRKVMASAEVGDSMFGEDPNVNKLEKTLCEHLGFQHALYVPSGTMSNQIAIGVHTIPGETVLAENLSHFYLYEAGATSTLSGVQFETIDDISDDLAIKSHIRPEFFAGSRTSLFVFENTHNEKGGDARSAAQTSFIMETLREFKLSKHLDGARIWNASCSLQCDDKDLVVGFDSASVCMSKGLGAPIGSVLLLNDDEKYRKALHLRKRFGGAMRQAGVLAAACTFAFENNRSRLTEDHKMREDLEAFLVNLNFKLKPISCTTNMIYLKAPLEARKNFFENLNQSGIYCFKMSEGYIRFVLHKDISLTQIDFAKKIIEQLINP